MIRLAVRVAAADAELVLAELLALSPSGMEEIEHADGTVEYAIYGAPGELPALPELEAAAGDALVRVSTRELADDWSERWREFHRPVVVAGRLRVRPPWAPASEDDAVIDIAIDPGQAFGTGAHATTRLCLELLLQLPARGPLLDAGCGSGVLAIAAAKLGFDPVIAVDNDPESVNASRANAAANRVNVDVRRINIRKEDIPAAPTVTANLLAGLLYDLSGRIEPPGPQVLIAGGLLSGQADDVAAEFAATHGLVERARRVEGDWAALLLAR